MPSACFVTQMQGLHSKLLACPPCVNQWGDDARPGHGPRRAHAFHGTPPYSISIPTALSGSCCGPPGLTWSRSLIYDFPMLFWGTEQEGVREEFMGALQRAEAYKPDIKTKYAIASLRKRLFLPMPPHISSSCSLVVHGLLLKTHALVLWLMTGGTVCSCPRRSPRRCVGRTRCWARCCSSMTDRSPGATPTPSPRTTRRYVRLDGSGTQYIGARA